MAHLADLRSGRRHQGGLFTRLLQGGQLLAQAADLLLPQIQLLSQTALGLASLTIQTSQLIVVPRQLTGPALELQVHSAASCQPHHQDHGHEPGCGRTAPGRLQRGGEDTRPLQCQLGLHPA